MKQGRSLLVRLVLSTVALLSLVATTRFAAAQPTPPRCPACFAGLRRAHLISPGIGWAIVEEPCNPPSEADNCSQQHLFWTETNGQAWRDITPPEMPTHSIGQVFFLDRLQGWMLSTDALGEENNARFYLQSTSDGGNTWSTLLLQRSAYKLMDDYTFPTQLFFSDAQHGWIVWHWALMNSRANALLATSDGGQTWERLPDPPGAGPLQFTSAQDGWMIGGSSGQEGIPIRETDSFWATRDGGVHWKEIAVPLPTEVSEESNFSALKFKNTREGTLTAETQLSGRLFRFITCVTHNGGRTWQFSQFDAYHATPSIADTEVAWSVFDWDTKEPSIRVGQYILSPALASGFPLDDGLADADFVDEANAWALYTNRQSRLVSMAGPTFAPVELLSTSDGGKTFQVITPEAAIAAVSPPPELLAVNGRLLRFPASRTAFALRRGIPAPENTMRPLLRANPGESLDIKGAGFLIENTVWFGCYPVQATSKDGEHLLLLVPNDLPLATYPVSIENAHGKTTPIQLIVGPKRPCDT